MRRTVICTTAFFLLFSGTVFGAELTPDMIGYGESTVALGSNEIPDEFKDHGAEFETLKDNTILSILVTGEDIRTFRDISVGDSASDVCSKFDLEVEGGGYITAIYGEEELDSNAIGSMDIKEMTDEILDAVILQYECIDDIVSTIYVARISAMFGLTPVSASDEEYPLVDIELSKEQIYFDGTIINFNEPAPDELSQYTEKTSLKASVPNDNPIKIIVNDENIVRSVLICDRSVQTFNGIRVGDSFYSIMRDYEKYAVSGGILDLIYRGDEMLGEEDLPADDAMIYTYYPPKERGGKIPYIQVSDGQFVRNFN